MKMIVRIAFAAAIAATFVGSAQAQRQRGMQPGAMQPGGGGGGFGSLRSMLATNKPLQEELKLTEDQITKFKDYAAKNARPMGMGMGMGMGPGGAGGFGGGGGGGGSDLDTLETLKAQIKTVEERIEFVKATLTKEQAERFAQLENQRLGIRAFTNARITKELKITDDQKKRIEEINKDYTTEVAKLFGGRGMQQDAAARAENAKKRTQLGEYAIEAIEKELTGEQKTSWAKLTGTKFDMSKLNPAPTTNN